MDILKPLFASTIFTLGLAQSADAFIITTYTDRSLWEAAVSGNVIIEDFNSITSDTDLSVDVGDFSISAVGPWAHQNGIEAYDPSPSSFQQDRNIDGTTYYQGDTDQGTTYTFSFDFGISAFAFDHTSLGSEGAGEFLTLDLEGVNYSIPSTQTGETGFFGIVNSDTELFTSVTFLGDDGAHGLDNISYTASSPTEVPEPGSLSILGLGIVGLVVSHKKKA
ncbi:MAG: PEP-CTERM sorting domain-containing protein [Cyanobacteria bacterium P01_G01_bin.54]